MMIQQQSGSGLYEIMTGRFKGLFNSEPASAIPDEYLADMKNLQISELGALKSVKTLSGPIDWKDSSGNTITSIGSYGMYVGQTDVLKDNQGNTKIAADGVGEMPVIRHLGYWYVLAPDSTGGLYRVDTGTKIAAATTGYAAVNGYYAMAVYEMRMWFGVDRTLRGSANGKDLGAVTAVNQGKKVWGPWVGPNSEISMVFPDMLVITHLASTQGGLLIFGEQDVFSMATYFGGKAVPIYHGPDLPHGIPGSTVVQFPYCDGKSVFYASDYGLYMFTSSPVLLSQTLEFSRIYSFSVCDYDGRIWFLVCTTGHPFGQEVNYIYAMNKRTGCWEKYDIQMTAKSGSTYNTPTAMCGGVLGTGESVLMIGTSIGTLYDWFGTMTDTGAMPWSFTTKAFSPSFDQPHYPCKFRIEYITQTTAGGATSPVTITTYLDGTLIPTTITLDMAEGTGGAFKHREFDVPTQLTANSVQFKVEGTGRAEILSVGYSLSVSPIGDTNP
jgi:hypothetical protein